MSGSGPATTAGHGSQLGKRGRRLLAYRPPWRDRRFWVLQGLVIGLESLHIAVDYGVLHNQFGELYFLPVALLLVPVVFAALTYGFAGAVATTLWVIALTIPDVVLWHEGLGRIGVVSELLLLGGIASVIGLQVDRERGLRRQTEITASALQASTMKYQGLLESSPVAILVISPQGAVLEANPAATILFGKDKATLEGARITDLLGAEAVGKLLPDSLSARQQTDPLTLKVGDRELFLEARLTETDDGRGNRVIQIMLRDVTEEQQGRAGLRAYAAEVLRALEDERQLMARELHDETIQTLIFLCRQIDSIIEETSSSLPPDTIARLKEVRKSAEEVVNGLRDFTKALRPPILDDLGITVSLRRLLTDFANRTKIEGQLAVAGPDRRLPSNIELGLFRIVQEALRNVERHARANYVAVIITFAEQRVSVDIVDNGIGFSTPTVSTYFTTSGQLGLISMQERAELLGGTLEIRSNPGKGTKVSIAIPHPDTVAETAKRRLEI